MTFLIKIFLAKPQSPQRYTIKLTLAFWRLSKRLFRFRLVRVRYLSAKLVFTLLLGLASLAGAEPTILITYDYYNASDYKKAKTNLFMFKVTSPFWAYIFIASYIVIGLDFKMILLGGIFLYYIISGSYTIKKEEKL